jgi:hypothetical protein
MSLIGMIVTPILIYFGVIFVVQLIVSLYKINSAGYYANDTISQFPEILSKQEVIRKDEKNMVTMRAMPQSQQQGQLSDKDVDMIRRGMESAILDPSTPAEFKEAAREQLAVLAGREYVERLEKGYDETALKIALAELEKKKLELKVSPGELERRKAQVKRPKKDVKGVLAAYRAGVSGAEKGAVWLYRDDF